MGCELRNSFFIINIAYCKRRPKAPLEKHGIEDIPKPQEQDTADCPIIQTQSYAQEKPARSTIENRDC
jgi:hypothetical protein